MRRRGGLEPFVAVEASLPRPGSSATAAENPEDHEKKGKMGTPHETGCRQPDDFSTGLPPSFVASASFFGARARSRFRSHSCSASFISRHHLK